MRLEEVAEKNPKVLGIMAELFKVEEEVDGGGEKDKSSWVDRTVFMSRGGIGHLLIIKKDGKGMLYVGEEIKPWMSGLIMAGIWSQKEERLSRGNAVNKLLRGKGYVYQGVEKDKMDSMRILMNRGINLAREERKERKRRKERERRAEKKERRNR